MDLKNYLIFLFMIAFLERSLFGVIVPFYPLLAKERHLNKVLIGLVFAMYAIGGVLSSIIIILVKKHKILKVMKSQITKLSFLMALTVFLFGLTKSIKSPNLFLFASLIFRLLQGFISNFMNVITYDLINITFEKDKISHQKFLKYYMVFIVMGDMLGPSIGSVIYLLFNYIGLFIFLGIIFIILSFFNNLIYIPNLTEENLLENFNIEINEEEKEEFNLKYYLKFPLIINFILMVLIYSNFYSIYPIYSINMKEQFKINKVKISLIFSTARIISIFALIFSAIFSSKINIKVQFNFGIIIQIIGLLFIAPTVQIGIPKEIWIVILGLNFSALGLNLCCTAIIVIFIEISEDLYGLKGKKIIDISALSMLSYSLSEFFGPFFGAFLSTKIKFSIEMLIFSMITLSVYLIYLLNIFIKKRNKTYIF